MTTVLLTLYGTWITSEESCFLQSSAGLRINLNQGTRDSKSGSAGLTCWASTGQINGDIELLKSLKGSKRLLYNQAKGWTAKVVLKLPAVDGDLTVAGFQENARN
jgi:hypothetical protein